MALATSSPFTVQIKTATALAVDSFSVDIGIDNIGSYTYISPSTGQTLSAGIGSYNRINVFSCVTKDGKILTFGEDSHGQNGPPDWTNPQHNGIREFDSAIGGSAVYTYPPNGSCYDQSRMDNKTEFCIHNVNWLGQNREIYTREFTGAWDRSAKVWLAGNLPPASQTGNEVLGTTNKALFYKDSSVTEELVNSTLIPLPAYAYNPHYAWDNRTNNCGFLIGGSPGGNGPPYDKMWLIVPSNNGINPTAVSQGNPFTLYQKTIPALVDGVKPHRRAAAMGCCFAGEYVYWFGGVLYDTIGDSDCNLFRMKITPHLTATNVSLTSGAGAIQLLSPAPTTPGSFPMLSYDAGLNCIVAWTGGGQGTTGGTARIWAYDFTHPGTDGVGSWVNVTPSNWNSALFGGAGNAPPNGVQGGYINSVQGHVFRPGYLDYGTPHSLNFFSLKLKRV